jgi:hypothetical protein
MHKHIIRMVKMSMIIILLSPNIVLKSAHKISMETMRPNPLCTLKFELIRTPLNYRIFFSNPTFHCKIELISIQLK